MKDRSSISVMTSKPREGHIAIAKRSRLRPSPPSLPLDVPSVETVLSETPPERYSYSFSRRLAYGSFCFSYLTIPTLRLEDRVSIYVRVAS